MARGVGGSRAGRRGPGPPDPRLPRGPQPAGGAWSTAADLVAFGRAYLHGLRGRRANCVRLLAPSTMAAMLRPQPEGLSQRLDGRTVPAQPRGLGFVLIGREAGADLHSPSACGHDGATGTRLVIDPEQDLVTVFLTNKWGFGDDGRRLRAVAINAAAAATSGE